MPSYPPHVIEAAKLLQLSTRQLGDAAKAWQKSAARDPNQGTLFGKNDTPNESWALFLKSGGVEASTLAPAISEPPPATPPVKRTAEEVTKWREAAMRAALASTGGKPSKWLLSGSGLYEGGRALISLDPSKPGRWRVTRFDKLGEPFGHSEAKDEAAAFKEARFIGVAFPEDTAEAKRQYEIVCAEWDENARRRKAERKNTEAQKVQEAEKSLDVNITPALASEDDAAPSGSAKEPEMTTNPSTKSGEPTEPFEVGDPSSERYGFQGRASTAKNERLDPTGGPYVAICAGHGKRVHTATKRAAEDAAADTRTFCDDCREWEIELRRKAEKKTEVPADFKGRVVTAKEARVSARGYPWAAICGRPGHGAVNSWPTKAEAEAAAADTRQFCGDCRVADGKPRDEAEPVPVGETLSPEAVTFGKKLAEKVKATATFKAALELLAAVPGWKVERFIGALPLKQTNLEEVGRKHRDVPALLTAPTSDTGSTWLSTYYQDSAGKGVSVRLARIEGGKPDTAYNLAPIRSQIEVSKTSPKAPKLGQVYASHFEEKKGDAWGTPVLFLYLGDLWLGTNAAKITSPKGESTIVYDEPKAKGMFGSAAFYTWAFKTTLPEDVKAALGALVKPQTEEEEARERLGTNDGTARCGICQRIQKTFNLAKLKPRLFDHGYTIPADALRSGWAPRHGSCFGSGKPPYEISTEAIELYLPILRRELADAERSLKIVMKPPESILRHEPALDKDRKPTLKAVVYTPKSPKWDSVLKSAQLEAKQNVEQLKSSIAFYEKAKADWKRMPTYDERQAGKLLYT